MEVTSPRAGVAAPVLFGPMWVVTWLTLGCLPVALAIALVVQSSPWPYLLALYAVLACTQRAVHSIDPPPPLTQFEPNGVPALNLIHPHGIVCHGVHVVMSRRRVGSVLITPMWALVYPLLLQFRWSAASASAASIRRLMRHKRDIWLYPGGFIEAMRHSHRTDVVYVGSRGAIRLALQNGYPLRVAFAFGERKTAHNLQGLWRVRTWLARRGIVAVVPWLVVFTCPARVVVSRTLDVPHIAAPTRADVERMHATYVATLRALHAQFKAHDDPPLVVLDRE